MAATAASTLKFSDVCLENSVVAPNTTKVFTASNLVVGGIN